MRYESHSNMYHNQYEEAKIAVLVVVVTSTIIFILRMAIYCQAVILLTDSGDWIEAFCEEYSCNLILQHN